MKSRQKYTLSAVIGLFLVAISVYFLKPAPAEANATHVQSTGKSCATCHFPGSVASAATLNAVGQNFVRCGYILNCAPTAPIPPQVAQPQQPNFQGTPGYSSRPGTANFKLGNVWIVQLREANGRFADLIWTRRGNSNSFDVLWHVEGSRFADVMNYEGYRNGQISFYSPTLKSRFTGAPSADGNYIYNGTISGANATPNDRWSATIFGN